jgi:hypothetical protein
MTTATSLSAAQLAARTPRSRDRYVDLLRVFSLAAVVLGHWLMAVLIVGADGRVAAANESNEQGGFGPLQRGPEVFPGPGRRRLASRSDVARRAGRTARNGHEHGAGLGDVVGTAGFIVAFRRADRPRTLPSRRYGTGRSVTGITLSLLGVMGFSAVGFGGALSGRTATLIVLPVSPLLSLALLVSGVLLLGLTVREATDRRVPH